MTSERDRTVKEACVNLLLCAQRLRDMEYTYAETKAAADQKIRRLGEGLILRAPCVRFSPLITLAAFLAFLL